MQPDPGEPSEHAGGAAVPAPQVEGPYLPRGPVGPSFRLWGTRGSIPISGAKFVRHGGNTSCVEVAEAEERIILDAGSGIRELGLELAKRGPRKLHLFITHTHWDHIQGFPFFAPAYIPGFELNIYGAVGFKKDLGSIFRGQLDSDYFPVQFEDMRAAVVFHALDKPPLRIGRFTVSWEPTHHPAVTLAYKISTATQTFGYVSDNEFLYGYTGSPQGIDAGSPLVLPHRRLVEFLRGVDLLVAEAQYTNEEYLKKIGWGHSSISSACLLAKLAGINHWLVTHHDPQHDDDYLDYKLNLTKEVLRSIEHPMEVRHGYDGLAEIW